MSLAFSVWGKVALRDFDVDLSQTPVLVIRYPVRSRAAWMSSFPELEGRSPDFCVFELSVVMWKQHGGYGDV